MSWGVAKWQGRGLWSLDHRFDPCLPSQIGCEGISGVFCRREILGSNSPKSDLNLDETFLIILIGSSNFIGNTLSLRIRFEPNPKHLQLPFWYMGHRVHTGICAWIIYFFLKEFL